MAARGGRHTGESCRARGTLAAESQSDQGYPGAALEGGVSCEARGEAKVSESHEDTQIRRTGRQEAGNERRAATQRGGRAGEWRGQSRLAEKGDSAAAAAAAVDGSLELTQGWRE